MRHACVLDVCAPVLTCGCGFLRFFLLFCRASKSLFVMLAFTSSIRVRNAARVTSSCSFVLFVMLFGVSSRFWCVPSHPCPHPYTLTVCVFSCVAPMPIHAGPPVELPTLHALQRYSYMLLRPFFAPCPVAPTPPVPTPLPTLRALLFGRTKPIPGVPQARGFGLRERLESVGFVRAATLDALDVFIRMLPKSGAGCEAFFWCGAVACLFCALWRSVGWTNCRNRFTLNCCGLVCVCVCAVQHQSHRRVHW